jgi:hypothetical protein
MLDPPNLADAVIARALRNAYGIQLATLEFLPIGADRLA